MIQAVLFEVERVEPCPYCGEPMMASAPLTSGGAVNVEFTCEEHGWQFTESTNLELVS